jgi:hypothetical protein
VRQLSRAVRRADTWAYALLIGVALIALGNGGLLIVQASGTGPESAAGWFVGVAGLALALLVAAAIRQDRRFVAQSVVTSIANTIVAEEEEAGRDVEQRFQVDLPLLPQRQLLRVLLLVAALIIAWMLLLPWLGFGVATGLFCFVYVALVARRRWWVALVAGAVIGGCLALLFKAVGVLVPTGALWYLLG